ncbi:MAG: hypothetical protein RL737_1911 [Bacteroidota bacterium]
MRGLNRRIPDSDKVHQKKQGDPKEYAACELSQPRFVQGML